jgi:glycosyltransferase involved in cell wall biosynthesis
VAGVVTGAPLISVIIPSYNYLSFIPKAIDSALAQTYPNVEVVVSDNCSTDGTVAALRERYAGDRRVRIDVNDENVGMLANFNVGFERSRGDFVLWLSADDWILPRHLERLAAVFAREPQIDVVYSGALFADEDERVYGMRQMAGHFPVDYVDARDELVEMLTTTCPLCWPTALFRRALFDELGLFDVSGPIASDWEMQVRMAASGKRFAYLADPSTVVRTHDAQLTGNDYHASGANIRDFVAILERYIDHPAMSRMRGREIGIVRYVDLLVQTAKQLPDVKPLEAGDVARIDAIKAVLTDRAHRVDLAPAREWQVSSIVTVMGGPVAGVIRAVDSIAAQTFSNVQIIVVDRGGIPLEHVLRAHAAWSRICYVRVPSSYSIGAARNVGTRMARGELIAYVDPDVTWAPDHLATLVDAIARGGHEAVASSSRLVIERLSATTAQAFPLGAAEGVYRGPGDPVAIAAVANALPLGAVLTYRRVSYNAGPFNEDLPVLEDFEYLLRVERASPIVVSARSSIDVHVMLGLSGSAISTHLPVYGPVLDLIYGGYSADAVAEARAVHRRAVEHAIANAEGRIDDPQGIANLVGTLAGRHAFPAVAG